MKIYFLGTCSGTEPMPGLNHTSIALECCDKLYFFDAGEGCSRTAHLMGLDLLKVKKIVISHPHMDHVGGIGNLLWTIRKLSGVKKRKPEYGDIEVYIPVISTFDSVLGILKNAEGGYLNDYQTLSYQVKDGLLFDDGKVKVTAFHNNHLKPNEVTRDYRSFSYRIEAEGKNIVYSGDVMGLSDLDELLDGYVDLLFIETGHHKVDGVYEYLKDKNIGKIYFMHHGREIINNFEQAKEKVASLFNGKAVVSCDGMMIDL